MVSISLTGLLQVDEQRSWRFKRRGESKTTHRHFRDTCTSLCHASNQLRPDSNQVFLRGHHWRVRQLSLACHISLVRSCHGWDATHKTYVDITRIKYPWSRDRRGVLPSASLQNGNHLSKSMTQSNKEVMARYVWETGRWISLYSK